METSHEADLRKLEKMPLKLLSRKVASHFKVKEEDLRSPVKKKSVTEAKSVFDYLTIKKMPAPCNAKLFHWGVFGTGNWEIFEYEKL